MPQPTALRDALRVKPGTPRPAREARSGRDLRPRQGVLGRRRRRGQMERLRDLQDRLWAEAKHSVLVVLQGIDAAGKDGTIAKVMEAFNPQGCPVTSFKVPTAEELAHDYLWRVHKRDARARARSASSTARTTRTCWSCASTTSSRSSVWSKRYDQINDFERTLAESGTTIVKFFLHDRPDEQRQRFQERYDDPTQALEVQHGRPRGAQALGRLPGRVRRGAVEDVDRRGRRGTSSRPTATGSATSPCRPSWPTRWPG